MYNFLDLEEMEVKVKKGKRISLEVIRSMYILEDMDELEKLVEGFFKCEICSFYFLDEYMKIVERRYMEDLVVCYDCRKKIV